MANITIIALSATGPINPNVDVVPIVNDGITKKATVAELLASASAVQINADYLPLSGGRMSGDLVVETLIETNTLSVNTQILSGGADLVEVFRSGSQDIVNVLASVTELSGNWQSTYESLSTQPYIVNPLNYSIQPKYGENQSTQNGSFVGSGACNITEDPFAVVAGGCCNTASGFYSTVGGGANNSTCAFHSTVGGGFFNVASSEVSTVAGGKQNTASGYYSAIGGGSLNTSSGDYSNIGGGYRNKAAGEFTSVLGGNCNIVEGENSAILGGHYNSLSATKNSFVLGSQISAVEINDYTFVNNLSSLGKIDVDGEISTKGRILSGGVDISIYFESNPDADVTKVYLESNYLPLTGGNLTGNLSTTGQILSAGVDIATLFENNAGVTSQYVSNNYLPLTGGNLTGDLSTTSRILSAGVDIATLVENNAGVTSQYVSNYYLPLTGGNLTGDLSTTSRILSAGVDIATLFEDNAGVTKVYLESTYLPLSGGNLTGDLSTTSRILSAGIDIATLFEDNAGVTSQYVSNYYLPLSGGNLTGNVGINTTNKSNALTVVGNISASGISTHVLELSSVPESTESILNLFGGYYDGNGTFVKKAAFNFKANGSYEAGYCSQTFGANSHAKGSGTTASGYASHAEGSGTSAIGGYSHSEGYNTFSCANASHAEGSGSVACGVASHAEGCGTIAFGEGSHAEGQSTRACGNYSHSEGSLTCAIGYASHASGCGTCAIGGYSHAEGLCSYTCGTASHAEGFLSVASQIASHAEGSGSVACGYASHAEGQSTRACGNCGSHSEGWVTTASGYASHSEGHCTRAIGGYSHSAGFYATANNHNSWIWKGSTLTTQTSTTRSHQFMVSAEGGSAFFGNVGINTDNIDNALTISGDVSATGNINTNGRILSAGNDIANLFNPEINKNYSHNYFLPLSGGLVSGRTTYNNDVTIYGTLSAAGGTYFGNTYYTTTSALSVVHYGSGDALYIGNDGSGHIASFNDLDSGVEVLHIGGENSSYPNVGVKTGTPNQPLTVFGNISGSNVIYNGNGNSTNWNAAYTNVGTLSTEVDNKVNRAGDTMSGPLTVLNTFSATNVSVSNLTVDAIFEVGQSVGQSGPVSLYVSENKIGINTETPNEALTVFGSISASGNISTSGKILSAGVDVATLFSGNGGNISNYDSVYNNVNSLSSYNESVYNNVNSLSTIWTSASGSAVNYSHNNFLPLSGANSSNWNSNYNGTNSLSSRWESNYNGTNSLSSRWDNTYTTVHAKSAIEWDNSLSNQYARDNFQPLSSFETAMHNYDAGGLWNSSLGLQAVDATGGGLSIRSSDGNNYITLNAEAITDNRQYIYPDKNGTLALTDDITNYLPLSGGRMSGNLTVFGNVSATGTLSAANIFLQQASVQTFVNPVTASGEFLILNINGTNRALRLWDFTS